MANKKSHLTREDRVVIEKCLKAGDSYREIARRVERGVSTVHEEVDRNGGRDGYEAKKAHHRGYLRQYRKKRACKKVSLDPFLTRFVDEKVRKKWSPERIAGHLKKEKKPYASPKAIRKFVRSRCLESHLYRKGKTRALKKDRRVAWEEDRIFVDDPACVREGYGHWEGDFIVSSKSTAVLLVLTERETKDTIIRLLPHRRGDITLREIVASLKGKTVRSLTLDNDVAFVRHRALSELINAPVYFARPYHSTDKPLVENTNRWIRWWVPKKKDINDVSKETVREIEEWINTVPRQCLGFASSREMVVLKTKACDGCTATVQKLFTGCSY